MELSDPSSSPPEDIFYIFVIFEQGLYKCKISVVVKEKEKRHLFTLYAEGNIMLFESGRERISTKQRMLAMSLCSEIYNMTFSKLLASKIN